MEFDLFDFPCGRLVPASQVFCLLETRRFSEGWLELPGYSAHKYFLFIDQKIIPISLSTSSLNYILAVPVEA